MTRSEIFSRLQDMMKRSSQEKVDWSTVRETTQIQTLGFDSLSILDLIYDLQQGFGIEFEAEELIGVKTVGDLITWLEQKTA